MRTYEVNEMTSCVKDHVNKNLRSSSPIVETFAAMVKGESVDNIKDSNGVKCGDRCVTAIKELNERAGNGDTSAISEINTIRSYVVNPLLLEEIKLMGFFGGYENLGYDESARLSSRTSAPEDRLSMGMFLSVSIMLRSILFLLPLWLLAMK